MMFLQPNRITAIAKKEFFHIFRDPFTLGVAFILPFIVVMIFGYAMEFNQKNISTTILDLDNSYTSRQLITRMKSSGYFKLIPVRSSDEGLKYVKGQRAKAFIFIPPTFGKNVESKIQSELQVIVDGADGASSGVIGRYLKQITRNLLLNNNEKKVSSNVHLKVRYLFNPELNSRWFSIPGIIVVIMAILCTLLTSLTIAREWEKGSMELLLSTPVKPLEIIVGKLLPYAIISLFSVFAVYILARYWFYVPFRGNHLLFLISCLIFLVGYLSLGLVISVTLRQQLTSMQAAMIVGLLPTTLLSGFIFPIENMPKGFQWFVSALPVRWFMDIARDQFLKGSSLIQLLFPISMLSLISLVLVVIAVKKFKGDLD